MSFTPQAIAAALGVPLANVQRYWPQIESALKQIGIDDHPTRIAALATIAVEVSNFLPIHEFGDDAYFTRMYQGRIDLGNLQPGDGIRFAGRGYIQLTGRANYTHYGQLLGLDLATTPDLALDPHVAALILALYFKEHAIPAMANDGNWTGVRVAVNGGNGVDSTQGGTTNGLLRFLACVSALSHLPEPPDPPVVPKWYIASLAGALKQAPNHQSRPAIGPHGELVHVARGQKLLPHGPEVRTGNEVWANVHFPDPSPIHGYYPVAQLTAIE